MFPTEKGMRLAWVYLAYMAMANELGFRPDDDERTYILLMTLDMVPHGVSAKRVDFPEHAIADCYNAAMSACYEVKYCRDWKKKVKRSRR